MRLRASLLAAAALISLTGCETTGDPNQGGLFGWSEAKAKERITKKENELGLAQGELAREQRTGTTLDRAAAGNRTRLAHEHAVVAAREANEASLRAEIASLRGSLEQLEADSPTSSGASRARALQGQLAQVENAGSVSLEERHRRLDAIADAGQRLRRQLRLP